MSVRIRLSRVGKKKAPFYRIVAIDKRAKRDGQCLENLGTYNPLTGEIVQFHADRVEDWVSKGAIPSGTVLRIKRQYAKHGKDAAKAAVKKVAPKVAAKAPEAKPAEKAEDKA